MHVTTNDIDISTNSMNTLPSSLASRSTPAFCPPGAAGFLAAVLASHLGFAEEDIHNQQTDKQTHA